MENEAGETLEHALDDARTAGIRAGVPILTEFMHTFRGMQVGRALAAAESALALAQDRSDVTGQIRALGRAALLYTDQLLLDRAAENGERALTLARGLGDESSIAEALDALKLVACQLGDTERLGRLASESSPSSAGGVRCGTSPSRCRKPHTCPWQRCAWTRRRRGWARR